MVKGGIEPRAQREAGYNRLQYHYRLTCFNHYLVENVGIDPTLPYGSGLQSEHDPYVSNSPSLSKVYQLSGIEPPSPKITLECPPILDESTIYLN